MGKAIKVKRGFRLARLDMARAMADEDAYSHALASADLQMLSIQQAYRRAGRSAILVFEGWDAGGKGGTIKRLTERLDPHGFHVWLIGPPTPEEMAQHYLRRFWQRLPARGQIAIFDRSWYGRVLVERVERLTPRGAWERAYDEINAFEASLINEGYRLVKIFLHISAEEQLKRFRERIASPYKRWKITSSDIRNHLLRRQYTAAIEDMFARTSTPLAPWFAVPGDAKWYARIAVLQTVIRRLGRDVDLAPPGLTPEFAATLRHEAGPKLAKRLGLDEKKSGAGNA